MDKANKIDKLFAIKAIEKKLVEERKQLESDAKLEMAQDYADSGVTQKRSVMFGKEAGTLSYIPPKDEEQIEWLISDWTALGEWLAKDPKAAEKYIFAHAQDFGQWWLDETGEIPDGIRRNTYTTTKPGSARLAVKEDVVISQLGGNLFEAANQLLLGDGDDR